MSDDFKPYWLLHEPGKGPGFATIPGDCCHTPEEAVAIWRASEDGQKWLNMLGDWPMTARLITTPFVP